MCACSITCDVKWNFEWNFSFYETDYRLLYALMVMSIILDGAMKHPIVLKRSIWLPFLKVFENLTLELIRNIIWM